MKRKRGMKASAFLELRNSLLLTLKSVDAEIVEILRYPKSHRAAERARELLRQRATLGVKLEALGIVIDPHPFRGKSGK